MYIYASLISWKSGKQDNTAQSTMEAEYVSANSAVRKFKWLRNLLSEMGFSQPGASTLFIDNKAALKLANNPVQHEQSKHINVRHHAIRNYIEASLITLQPIGTEYQRADIFTRSLAGPRHARMCAALRLCVSATPRAPHHLPKQPRISLSQFNITISQTALA